jgi:hypothetical protein
MAKKKTERPKDQHRSGFMVRLPEAYRDKLAELKRSTERSYTVEVRRALDAHLKANGIEPPPASST